MEANANELVAAMQRCNLPDWREAGCGGMVTDPLEASIVASRGTVLSVKSADTCVLQNDHTQFLNKIRTS